MMMLLTAPGCQAAPLEEGRARVLRSAASARRRSRSADRPGPPDLSRERPTLHPGRERQGIPHRRGAGEIGAEVEEHLRQRYE